MILVSSFCLLLDQLIKCIIDKMLYLHQTLPIVSSFFSITYVKNEGAAWSLFAGRKILLIIISLLAIFALYYYFVKGKQLKIVERVSYGLLFGGILGNLLDRIARGYVIDFLEFTIFGYHFPIFNIADICIVIGIFFIIIYLWKGDNKYAYTKSHER